MISDGSTGKLLEGQDAVIDMAALSNDPGGELDPWKTFDINYLGRARVARLAREARVPRYILTSSCSVYGFRDGILDESTPPNPLTAYARANILAEKDTLLLATDSFCPMAVRFATLYGLSGRMRFDLAINAMVLGARTSGKIPIMKDGTQWRPFLHVRDAAAALSLLLSVEGSRLRGQVFNIGSDAQNYQISQLAELVAGSMRSRPELDWYGDPDRRSVPCEFPARPGRTPLHSQPYTHRCDNGNRGLTRIGRPRPLARSEDRGLVSPFDSRQSGRRIGRAPGCNPLAGRSMHRSYRMPSTSEENSEGFAHRCVLNSRAAR